MGETSGLTVGEAIVAYLEAKGISVVFGIPGVHTIELYRGLADSSIRHVTPRHEQGAGFMADGYARAGGGVGVAFVITGPGMTNILTPMAQALSDSVPMLVVSSVNEDRFIGRGLGHLHELPDQHRLVSTVALRSEHVASADGLLPALDTLFEVLESGRPGPVHLQVPLDVMGQPFMGPIVVGDSPYASDVDAGQAAAAAAQLNRAERPVIIAGGGSRAAADDLRRVAETLDAPVVQTINARDQMHDHSLRVPASPSLDAVRRLLADADAVLAVGTELGPTDFDVYHTGTHAELPGLVRIDVDPDQIQRRPCEVAVAAKAETAMPLIADALVARDRQGWGAERAREARQAARAELSPGYRDLVALVEAIRDALPGSIIVGDSSQLLYAANMYYGHDAQHGWFNSSVGFGALGYAIPAALGAAVAAPDRPIVCLTGDGGAQFTLPELMVAADEQLPVVFVVWNNFGYGEIADAMRADGVGVLGCDPTPPDFAKIAAACSITHRLCAPTAGALAAIVGELARGQRPAIIEVRV